MLKLAPKQIVKYLFWVGILFDGLSFLAQLPQYTFGYSLPAKIVDFLNVGGEYNPQAWYSSLLLVLCSLLLFLISMSETGRFSNHTFYWRGLGLIFIYLSMDEILLFHERAGELLNQYVHTGGIFRYAWVIIAIPICIVFGLLFLRFLLNLPHKTRQLFLLAAGLYVGSALVLELVEGLMASFYGEKSIFDFLLVAIEEFFEKFGIIVFIYALLLYIGLYIKSIVVEDR